MTRDPIATTRRELALRYAARGTTLQLARAVTVLELTGGADYSPTCRHAITSITRWPEGVKVHCVSCGLVLP